MLKIMLLGVLALAGAASAASCPVQVQGKTTLKDAHHVGYTVTLTNPTAQALTVNMRLDFFYKGKKLSGGFENLRGTIPAKGKKTFSGSEAFTDTLKGVDAAKVTDVRKCE